MSKIVEPYLRKLKYLKDHLEDIGQRAVKENVELIIYTLQNTQLSKGIATDGSYIGRYKSYTSLIASDPHRRPRTGSKKPAGQPYDMEWTGMLFDSMMVKADRDSFSIFSSTGKDEFLKQQGYKEFMGLTKQNNEMINQEVILPYMRKYILDNFMLV